jgi:hypothetical protein
LGPTVISSKSASSASDADSAPLQIPASTNAFANAVANYLERATSRWRDGNEAVKVLLKDKKITEDEDKRAHHQIRKLTNTYMEKSARPPAPREKKSSKSSRHVARASCWRAARAAPSALHRTPVCRSMPGTAGCKPA